MTAAPHYSHVSIAPNEVHHSLRRHMQLNGHRMVLDLQHSHQCWAVDALNGDKYLDLASFYGSNPVGYNHPGMKEPGIQTRLSQAATFKVGNPDFYSQYLAEFVETLARTAGIAEFPNYFFVEGGALAVENGMKVAFDWKVRKNLARGKGEKGQQVVHFESAFHGRSGYTLSVTNTDPNKTAHFPKFPWPRFPVPSLRFPLTAEELSRVAQLETEILAQIERSFDENPDDIAAILIEPIQSEGGDHHFRPEFLRGLRKIADEREALLIFDEVQTGMGITGSWWAAQHLGVMPDVICFAKKLQVGGIFVSRRVDDVDSVFKVPSRISSTWGGGLVDMVRATRILEIIEQDRLLDNVKARGAELQQSLAELAVEFPNFLSNARGAGLLCAFDLPTPEIRKRVLEQTYKEKLLLLACGTRTIRFRPHLTVSPELLAEGLRRVRAALRVVQSDG